MKMKSLITCLILGLSSVSMAQNPALKFNKEGKFKIVQFTDVHYKYRNPTSDIALKRINEVLDAEHPDLVIFTGDVIYAAPADTAMRTVLACVSSRKIPFAVTLGNHDDEQDKTRAELYDVIRNIPYHVNPEHISAEAPDFTLQIQASDADKSEAVLYLLDSHSYSKLPDVKGYDWLTFQQVCWYREQSASFTRQNKGMPLPALAFFHIPLPEYHEAVSDKNAILKGTRMEKVCAPALNSGMFTAMKESGDVMGIFVGHDHDNDYAVMWKDILLAYGRYTGGNTEYNHLPNGARIIILQEGKRQFTTYIRQKNGEIVDKSVYPDSYVKDDWRKRQLQTE